MNMNQFSIMLKIKNNLINKNKKELQENNDQKEIIKKDYKQTYFIDVIDRLKKDKIENKGEIKDNTSIHYNYIKFETIKYLTAWVKKYLYKTNDNTCDTGTTNVCAS